MRLVAISSLSAEQLRGVVKKIEACKRRPPISTIRTQQHLAQVKERITKALDADYILNPSRQSSSFGGGSIRFILEDHESGQIIQDQVVPIEP